MSKKVDDFLEYNQGNLIGGDGHFSRTFQGTLNGEPVVVNQTLLTTIETITKDEDLLKLRHPNIAHLLYVTKDADFRYDALEPYAASLDCLFLRNDDPKKYRETLPSNEQVLLQLANGLSYLHTQDIMHGDIKPKNILISSTEESSVQMKWTRFGFKQSNLNDSCSVTPSVTRMRPRKWWPPEMYESATKQITVKGEIFSAGCVFLYYLSGGLHPFASPDRGEYELEMNVSSGNPNPDNLIRPQDLSTTHFDSVKEMIKKEKENRIALRLLISDLERQDSNNQQQFNFPSLSYTERNGRHSCGLFLSEPAKKLVVKRIPIDHCSDKSSIKKCSKLNHLNIVRLLEYYEEAPYKYFRLEFCSASLDQRFLPEGDPKKYTGPMPSHEQFFLQLVTGLQYIHDENGLVHGSIKPSNVLINGMENPLIKLADFGLMAQRWDYSNNSLDDANVSGFQSERYWLAPELREIFEDIEPNGAQPISSAPTINSDIFSTGKVFFYYYYQSYAELGLNSKFKTENQENVFKKLPIMGYYVKEKNKGNISAIQLINEMTKQDFKSRLPLLKVIEHVKSFELTSKGELGKPQAAISGDIHFCRDYILGVGNNGVVYLGMWAGSIAAVKRIMISPLADVVIEREKQLQQLDHCNVVKFYGSGKDSDFMYIAIEKCLMSVDTYCQQPQLYYGVIPMPSDKQVLLQMATGLQYIHLQNLIHRDVKPGNILISGDKQAVLKWCDFGVSKKMDRNGVEWSSRQGTKGWMAPEVDVETGNDQNVIAGDKSDIFSLGCVFFFFLTPAIHPFGNSSDERRKNIKSRKEPKNINKLSEQHFAFNIIIEMIKFEPLSRITTTEIIEYLLKAL